MRRTFAIIIGVLALGAPAAGAQATRHSPRPIRHRHKPSRIDVRRAIRAYTAPDHPISTTARHCRRTARFAVSCAVTEHDVPTAWTEDGQPIVGDLSYDVRVTWHAGRIRIGSPLFTESVTLGATK